MPSASSANQCIFCFHQSEIVVFHEAVDTYKAFTFVFDRFHPETKRGNTAEELIEIVTDHSDPNYIPCSPTGCNCSPEGYQEGIKCPNPFWPSNR